MNSTYDIIGNGLHAYRFSQDTKPINAINTLFNYLKPVSSPFSLEADKTFNLSPKRDNSGIILLDEGICSICHEENSLHIYSFFARSIIGFIDGYSLYYDVPARPQHKLCAETDCTGYYVQVDDFVKVADDNRLWHDVARVLAHRLMVMSARENELVGVDSYRKVRSLLIELWAYPEEYRRNINVQNFIQRRTMMSRSRTLKILSELRKGEFISIDNGKLTSIQKLPEAY